LARLQLVQELARLRLVQALVLGLAMLQLVQELVLGLAMLQLVQEWAQEEYSNRP